MLSVAEALERVLSLVRVMDAEEVPLELAHGRALAGVLTATRTQPPFPSSAMDGYAVRRAEAEPGMSLTVVGEAAAGRRFAGTVGAGQAVRIFTGAPVPEGADDILIQEDAERSGDRITVREGRDEARYIRPAGTDFSEGSEFVASGALSPQDIALLAAMGHARVPVRRKPVVALIATGDELVMPGEVPGPDQIVSSNNFGLAALLARHGATPRILPVARDDPAHLGHLLELARGSDLIVTLGGASVGDHDLVQATAVAHGMALDFYKIAMRPGKPLMAGQMGDVPMIGLPGNPVSAMVCGHVFVLPAIRALLGLEPGARTVIARLAHDIGANGPRAHYMRAVLSDAGAERQVTVMERQDSSLLSVLQSSNALAIRTPRAEPAAAGDVIEVMPLDG